MRRDIDDIEPEALVQVMTWLIDWMHNATVVEFDQTFGFGLGGGYRDEKLDQMRRQPAWFFKKLDGANRKKLLLATLDKYLRDPVDSGRR